MSTRSLNKVMLIGNLTRDTELRYTGSGTPVATFSIATNRNYKDSSGNSVETAEFTNCVAWSKLAEICANLLKKGTKVYIEGRLSTSKWTDNETGKEMRRTEVVATDMLILAYPRGGEAPESSENIDTTPFVKSDGNDVMGEDVDLSSLNLGDEVENKDKDEDDSDENPSETPF